MRVTWILIQWEDLHLPILERCYYIITIIDTDSITSCCVLGKELVGKGVVEDTITRSPQLNLQHIASLEVILKYPTG